MSWIVDLKASKLAEAMQDSGYMFQVVIVLGENRVLISINPWLNWYQLHAVASPSRTYSGSDRMVIHWHGD